MRLACEHVTPCCNSAGEQGKCGCDTQRKRQPRWRTAVLPKLPLAVDGGGHIPVHQDRQPLGNVRRMRRSLPWPMTC